MEINKIKMILEGLEKMVDNQKAPASKKAEKWDDVDAEIEDAFSTIGDKEPQDATEKDSFKKVSQKQTVKKADTATFTKVSQEGKKEPKVGSEKPSVMKQDTVKKK